MSARFLAALPLVIVGACHRPASVEPPAPQSQDHSVRVDASMLERLSLSATSTLPDDETTQAWMQRIESGEASLDDYIDELLASPNVAAMLSRLMFRKAMALESTVFLYPYILERTAPDAKGRSAYVLASAPNGREVPMCDPVDAVSVRPWWDMESEVLICPNSYKPEKFWFTPPKSADGREPPPVHCSSYSYAAFMGLSAPDTKSLCGCGPNLARCVRDGDHMVEVNDSLANEVVATMADALEHGRSFRDLLTSNETVRDRTAEFTYRRWLLENGQDAHLEELSTWPEDGKRAPRPEVIAGQHSGVLTSNKLIYFDTGARQRLRTWYEFMWCKTPAALGATPEDVLSLQKSADGENNLTDVERDAELELASRPVCTSCHARLDYGVRFLLGWGNGVGDMFAFNPDASPGGEGPLYGDDISDPRGRGALTTQAFANLAIEQPEYQQCVAQTLAEHFLGTDPDSSDVDAIARAVSLDGPISEAVRAALRRAALLEQQSRPLGLAPLAMAPLDAGDIRIEGELRAALDEHCYACHDGDLVSATPPRDVVVTMLEKTAFHEMPKAGHALDLEARKQLVGGLVRLLWRGEEQEQAMEYFRDGMRPFAVQNLDATLDAVHRIAGVTIERPIRTIQNGVPPRVDMYTPDFAATGALEAVTSCREAKREGDSFEACVREATDPELFRRGRVP